MAPIAANFFCNSSASFLATPALTDHVFNSPRPDKIGYSIATESQKTTYEVADKAYNDAADQVGAYMGYYGLSSMLFALALTFYTSRNGINRKLLHVFSLIAGSIGFLSMYWINDSRFLLFSFGLIGLSWGSVLSMPYAMLSSFIDSNKMGLFMGIFNMFIVIPQIIAAIGGINLLTNFIGDKVIFSMVVAGLSLIIAGLLNLLITDKKTISY